jgi:tetratricopeptide (TPR) repeat protein
MTRTRLVMLCALAAPLAGCGSKPVQPPATVSNAQSFMASGMQAYNDNRYAEARNFFGRAFMEYRSVDDLERQADALTDLADAALQQGDVTSARDQIRQARAITDAHPVAGLPARLTLLEAYADLQSQDPAAAATTLDGLLNDATTPADVRRAALFARTQAAFDAKTPDVAPWLAKLGAPQGDLDQARLERLQALADTAQAPTLYADALHRYQAAYYRPGIAATHEEWGNLLLSQRQWKDARDHLKRALDIRLWMYDATHSVRILDGMQQADAALGDSTAAKQDADLAAYLKEGGDPSKSPVPANNP